MAKQRKRLVDTHPDVAVEYMPHRNDVQVDAVAPSSRVKRWWQCSKCGHQWEASVGNRTYHGSGCPACSGRVITVQASLAGRYPEIARSWHPTKNGNTEPSQVAVSSTEPYWWICDNSPEHVWSASPVSRIKAKLPGNYCPECKWANLGADGADNSLAAVYPKVAEEWDYDKNGDLTPQSVSKSSGKKCWWRCERGHSWDAPVYSRVAGHGCRICAGQEVDPDRNLATEFPDVAAQWHHSLNGELTPEQVAPHSGIPRWWECDYGHPPWKSSPHNRAAGKGCIYCAGMAATPETSFEANYPDLMKEWHPAKNSDIDPSALLPFSNKRVWWRCEAGHEWQAILYSRTKGNGCAQCAGLAVTKENCLAANYPALLEEWHPTRNGELTPDGITARNPKNVWWQCAADQTHEWQASPYNRTNGRGCPYCHIPKKSKEEILLAAELSLHVALEDEAPLISTPGKKWRPDIVIADKKIVIEYDGSYWHQGLDDRDNRKTQDLTAAGYQVIRIREAGLEPIKGCSNVDIAKGDVYGAALGVLAHLRDLKVVSSAAVEEYAARGGVSQFAAAREMAQKLSEADSEGDDTQLELFDVDA